MSRGGWDHGPVRAIRNTFNRGTTADSRATWPPGPETLLSQLRPEWFHLIQRELAAVGCDPSGHWVSATSVIVVCSSPSTS